MNNKDKELITKEETKVYKGIDNNEEVYKGIDNNEKVYIGNGIKPEKKININTILKNSYNPKAGSGPDEPTPPTD